MCLYNAKSALIANYGMTSESVSGVADSLEPIDGKKQLFPRMQNAHSFQNTTHIILFEANAMIS